METVTNQYPHLDEIVFENRNKEYGAYPLRKAYDGNLIIGVLATLTVLLLALAGPAIYDRLKGDEEVIEAPARKLVYTELSAPPPIDKPKPPPPQIALPKLQKVIKFVPPKVVKESVTDVAPTIEEIKNNETASVAVEGNTDVVFDEPVEGVVAEDNEVFTVVEQQPEFEGGYDALRRFLKENMRYPKSARRMGVDGTVHVSFLVNKTGSISEVKVLRGISADCDAEAIRVVEKMPPWKPGKQNGRAVYVRMIMPIKFSLNG